MCSSKPAWLKVQLPSYQNFFHVSSILKNRGLNSICQSAKCPNISECWSQKTATFLILGDTCTRSCKFCAVKKGSPLRPSTEEPAHVAEAVELLGLKYVVITSVTRDDLPDGGASHFVRTIAAVRRKNPEVKIEILIPDFGGCEESLEAVLAVKPDILNHNLETTKSLYLLNNRPKKNYQRSLKLLEKAKARGSVTKSGLMIGLGEKYQEILQSFSDLRRVGCDLLTIGQYLRPSLTNVPVKKYYSPFEFEQLKNIALGFGFKDVESGPLVRSSFEAHKLYNSFQEAREA